MIQTQEIAYFTSLCKENSYKIPPLWICQSVNAVLKLLSTGQIVLH